MCRTYGSQLPRQHAAAWPRAPPCSSRRPPTLTYRFGFDTLPPHRGFEPLELPPPTLERPPAPSLPRLLRARERSLSRESLLTREESRESVRFAPPLLLLERPLLPLLRVRGGGCGVSAPRYVEKRLRRPPTSTGPPSPYIKSKAPTCWRVGSSTCLRSQLNMLGGASQIVSRIRAKL